MFGEGMTAVVDVRCCQSMTEGLSMLYSTVLQNHDKADRPFTSLSGQVMMFGKPLWKSFRRRIGESASSCSSVCFLSSRIPMTL
jgi:hypothetical protein